MVSAAGVVGVLLKLNPDVLGAASGALGAADGPPNENPDLGGSAVFGASVAAEVEPNENGAFASPDFGAVVDDGVPNENPGAELDEEDDAGAGPNGFLGASVFAGLDDPNCFVS